jgi:dGTPase
MPVHNLQRASVSGDAERLLSQRRWIEAGESRSSGFGRDRERIVQSRAFRRLAGKTQVFTSRESDHFRSRLTHTIEVVQIAREVARALSLNEELVEALALVHDIGHPPFGHAGERALDACLKQHGMRFDHNLHALRIVEHFEDWYAAHRGLNLTLGVREGIVKHSRDYFDSDHPELADLLLEQRPPLEAQLIDLADEIAYLTADLDDGVESGLLERDHICANIAIMGRSYADVEKEHPGVEPKFLFHEALQKMQSELTTDLIETTATKVAARGLETLADVRACPERVATFSPSMEAQRREEKAYLYRVLYTCDFLEAEHNKAKHVVTTLFDFFMKDPESMPAGYMEESETEGLPRVVADYIAGMTDAYALQQFWTASKAIR